jgi:bifunctional UDP-N-acetylglucosamine pyrophosphorylase/glucosamine-1-phosphate N-acetyltransferase
MSLEVVILAAGKGTRMNSGLPKVLHRVGGRPMLDYVLLTALKLDPSRVHLVTGYDSEAIRNHIDHFAEGEGLDLSKLVWVKQEEQLGTGHAVSQATPHINDSAVVLVLYADVPLINSSTLQSLVEIADTKKIALLTVVAKDPTGYGRILRDADSRVTGIVEHNDCTSAQKELSEINTGIIAAPGDMLKRWLTKIDRQNAQDEYYLTDIVALGYAESIPITTVTPHSVEEVLGVNNLAELARVERACQARKAEELMISGVTIMDPTRVDIRGDVEIGAGSVLDINVVIEGPSRLGREVHVGPNSTIRGSVIGDQTRINENCVIEGANVGTGGIIGPFARLRPGTLLGDEVHVGNFVEVKNSKLENRVKANHLSYIGDATVGEASNVGAGMITCNYDGADKHHTEIGKNVFVGSDVQLVAPVTVGDNASIGAGSTITTDVPEGSLAVSRNRQRNISGWKRPVKKPAS